MKRIKQILMFGSVLLSIVFFNSCLDETVERTREMEEVELETYLKGLESEGYDIDTTDLGVYYVMIDEGEGPTPQEGDTLSIGYAGYFIDGSLFDTSELNFKNGLYTFIYKVDPMIAGFEEGLSVMNKGAKIQMIIPSDLAYGANGTTIIPKYASLIFVTKLDDLKSNAELTE